MSNYQVPNLTPEQFSNLVQLGQQVMDRYNLPLSDQPATGLTQPVQETTPLNRFQTMSIDDLEADPQFAKLNYIDQQYLRSQWFQEQLPVNPRLQSLSEADINYVYDTVLNRSPVLTGKNKNAKAMLDIMNTIKAENDPKKLEDFANVFRQASGENLADMIFGVYGTSLPIDTFLQVQQLATGQSEVGPDNPDFEDINQDASKLIQHVRGLYNRDTQNLFGNLFGGAGIVLSVGRGATTSLGKLGEVAKGTTLGNIASTFAGKAATNLGANTAAKFISGKLLPWAGGATVEALTLLPFSVKQTLQDKFASGELKPTVTLGEVALLFGTDVAMDGLIRVGASVLKGAVKQVAGNIRTLGSMVRPKEVQAKINLATEMALSDNPDLTIYNALPTEAKLEIDEMATRIRSEADALAKVEPGSPQYFDFLTKAIDQEGRVEAASNGTFNVRVPKRGGGEKVVNVADSKEAFNLLIRRNAYGKADNYFPIGKNDTLTVTSITKFDDIPISKQLNDFETSLSSRKAHDINSHRSILENLGRDIEAPEAVQNTAKNLNLVDELTYLQKAELGTIKTGNQIDVPSTFTNPKTLDWYKKTILDEIIPPQTRTVDGAPTKVFEKATSYLNTERLEAMNLTSANRYAQDAIKSIVKNKYNIEPTFGYKDGQFQVVRPDTGEVLLTGSSMSEIGVRLQREHFTEINQTHDAAWVDAISDKATSRGYELQKDTVRQVVGEKSVTLDEWKLVKNGKTYAKANSVDELIAAPQWAWLIPNVTSDIIETPILWNPGSTFKVERNAITGSLASIQDRLYNSNSTLNKAAKRKARGAIAKEKQLSPLFDKTSKGRTIVPEPKEVTFKLKNETTGVTMKFQSEKELKDFLQQNTTALSQTSLIARAKGFYLSRIPEGYMVQEIGSKNSQLFTNFEAAKSYLAGIKNLTPDAPPELIRLGRTLVEDTTPLTQSLVKELNLEPPLVTTKYANAQINFTTGEKIGQKLTSGTGLFASLTNMTPSFVEKIGRWSEANAKMFTDAGIPAITRANLSKTFDKLVQAYVKVYNPKANAIKASIEQLSHKVDLEKMRAFLETTQSQWSKLEGEFGKLTEPELRYLQGYRKITDRMSEMFKVDTHKLLQGYMPHIRAQLQLIPKSSSVLTMDAEAWLKETFFNRQELPKEFKFLHDQTRFTPDGKKLSSMTVAEYKAAYELADPTTALVRYFNQAAKKAFLEEPLADVLRVIKPLETLKPDFHSYMVSSMREMVGWRLDYSNAEKRLIETSRSVNLKVYDAMSKNPAAKKFLFGSKTRTDLETDPTGGLGFIHSLAVSGTQAWRPYHWFRNNFDHWTRSVLIGMDYSLKGLDRASNMTIQEMTELQMLGVLKYEMSSLGQMSATGSFIDNYNHLGMLPFQATDITNRAAAFYGAESRFLDGIAQFERGEVSFDTFRKSSRIAFLDLADQEAIVNTLRTSGKEAAAKEYGLRFSRFTQGTYENWSNPVYMQSLIGKMFGMFSHYPNMYLNFVKNILVRSPKDMLVAVVPTLAAMTGAIIALHQATQTRSDSYMPWNQMFFLGGPVSDLTGETLSQMDKVLSGQTDILQASTRLLSQAGKVFVPGSAIFRSYAKAIEAWKKGDNMAVMNFIMTAPYLDTNGEYK